MRRFDCRVDDHRGGSTHCMIRAMLELRLQRYISERNRWVGGQGVGLGSEALTHPAASSR
jgi:hypothetical protein